MGSLIKILILGGAVWKGVMEWPTAYVVNVLKDFIITILSQRPWEVRRDYCLMSSTLGSQKILGKEEEKNQVLRKAGCIRSM